MRQIVKKQESRLDNRKKMRYNQGMVEGRSCDGVGAIMTESASLPLKFSEE
jgi:hypothetical protein